MAQQRAPGLAAIIPDEVPSGLLPDQRRVVEAMKAWREKEGAFLQLQSTRPHLAGYVLADSPVAQAAWIYDIFNFGTGHTGNPEAVLSRDAMLDEITLYWLTKSATSSARFYLEQAALLDKHNNPGPI